jgi:hypothetical protein
MTAPAATTLADACIIRLYRDEDAPGVLALFRSAFSHYRERDPAYWAWINEPNRNSAIRPLIAEHEGRVVGAAQHILMKIDVGGRTLDCLYGPGTAIEPRFRGTGLRQRMRRGLVELCGHDSYLTYYNATNPVVLRDHAEQSVRRFPRTVRVYLAIRDLPLHLRRVPRRAEWLASAGHVLRRAGLRWMNLRRPRAARFRGDIVEIERFDGRFEPFWREVRPHHRFIVERTVDYMNWRYCDPRGGRCVVKEAEEEGRVVGYSALTVTTGYEADFACGSIIDLLALPGRQDVVDALAKDALRHFADGGLNVVRSLALEGSPCSQALERRGFAPWGGEFNLFYREAATEPIDLAGKLAGCVPGEIHVCQADLP